eukprot:9085-Pelagococcus_subviridis.AAC.6
MGEHVPGARDDARPRRDRDRDAGRGSTCPLGVPTKPRASVRASLLPLLARAPTPTPTPTPLPPPPPPTPRSPRPQAAPMDDETPEEVPPDSQIVSQIGRRAARGGPGAPPPRRPPPPPPEVSPWSQGAYLKAQRAPGLHFDSDESDSEDEAAAAAATVALVKTAGGAKT